MLKKFIRDHQIHKSVVSSFPFDHIFFCKPIYIFGPIAMLLVGMYLASFANGELVLGLTSVNIKTSLFALGVSLICCSVFIKNEILSINENSNFRFKFIETNLVGDKINIKTAELMHNILLGIGFLLVLATSWINLFFIALIYFSCLYVSKSPENLYNNLGLLSLIAFFFILSGWLYADNLLGNYLKLILFFLLSFPYICLFVTTAMLINFGSSKFNATISVVLITIGFLIAYYNNDPVGATTLSVCFPFYLFLFFRGSERDLVRAIRYPIFLLNFFLFTIYPLVMIPMTIIYYLSKYYYWHRFNIHFPALAINDDYN